MSEFEKDSLGVIDFPSDKPGDLVTRTADLPDIVVDSNEPDEFYLKIKGLMPGKRVEKAPIPTDVIIYGNPGWAIERKTVGDFLNTWFKGDRLSDQLEMLKMLAENAPFRPAVLIVGTVGEAVKKRKNAGARKVNPLSVINGINSIPSQWGIPMFRADYDWTAPYVIRYLAEKVTGEKRPFSLRKGAAKEMTPAEQAEYVLNGFPGIGAVTAQRVKECNPNLFKFCEAVMGYSPTVGLTNKVRDKVRTVLEAEWK